MQKALLVFHQYARWFILLAASAAVSNAPLYASPVGSTYVAQKRPIISTVTLSGTVIPAREVTLAAQLPGRVNMIAGEEGSSFKKDDLLLSLDDTELLAQRRAALAEYANADATLRNAGIQYSKELWSPESISTKAPGGMGVPYMFDQLFTEKAQDVIGRSDSRLDREATLHTYGTQVEQARNSLMRAQAQLDTIDAKLRDARSIAPFDGIITKKMAEIGDTVQPGMPLLKFADVGTLQIQAEVPARLVPGLYVGMMVPARLDVGGWGRVRVAQIFPIADRERHTVTVKFELPPGTRTGPGQYAQVNIQDINAPVEAQIVIPRAALVQRGSLPSVYVIKGDQRELRMVRIGDSNAQEVIVLSGLDEGETIEINPPPSATSGRIQRSGDR
jgi:multidrug efflux pump subunit AcrA (membrane-fusion protein)